MLSLLLSAGLAAFADTSSVFNENTMAFYAFDDGIANESAVSGVVGNKVDSSKYKGTITAMKGSTSYDGTAHWLPDAPAKYIFERGGYKPNRIYTNPACVQVEQLRITEASSALSIRSPAISVTFRNGQ